jgi:hypothetical protein
MPRPPNQFVRGMAGPPQETNIKVKIIGSLSKVPRSTSWDVIAVLIIIRNIRVVLRVTTVVVSSLIIITRITVVNNCSYHVRSNNEPYDTTLLLCLPFISSPKKLNKEI